MRLSARKQISIFPNTSNHSYKHLSRWCVTDIQEPMQIQVFDCKVRNEGSMDLW